VYVILLALLGFGMATPLISAITYTYSQIKVPNSIATAAAGVNSSGQIVGWFNMSTGGPHGYLLDSGTFTTLDYPHAASTVATSINDSGEIVGYYVGGGRTHGFTLINGQYTSFDYPGAKSTNPYAINNSGQIVGYYYDQQNTIHGF